MSTRSRWSKIGFPIPLICFLVGVHTGYGQLAQTARFEFPLGPAEFEYPKVVSLREKGLLLYRRLQNTKGIISIEVTRIDSSLHQVWKGYIPLDQNLRVLQTATFDDHLYILLRNSVNDVGNFLVLSINSNQGEYKAYQINNLIRFQPKEFVVTQTSFLIGGYFNYRPLVLHYSVLNGEAAVVPGFVNEQGELLQIKPYEDGSFDILVGAKNLERQKCIFIRNYDSLGNLVHTIALDPGPKKNLLFGQTVTTNSEGHLVAGTYGRFTDYARGLFIANINTEGEYQINYYNLGDLQNFFSYLKGNHERRIKNRIERRKMKGKPVKFNYRFLVHALVPYQDKFIMLGEAFFPTYRYASAASGGGFYNPYRNDMVFDGYQYTHAVIVGFNKNGKMLWDNSFEINDIKSYQLEQFVKVHPEEKRIILLYLFQDMIRSKIINGDKVVEGKASEEIKAPTEKAFQIEATESTKLDYWYGNNFYVWGVQHVRDLSPIDSPSRKVFFITKVTYP